MRDLWRYRWKAMGLYFMFYTLFWIGVTINNLLWVIGTIGTVITTLSFLIISSSHNGWLAKRRVNV